MEGELGFVVDNDLERLWVAERRYLVHELATDGSDVLGQGGGEHHHLLLVRGIHEDLLHDLAHVCKSWSP